MHARGAQVLNVLNTAMYKVRACVSEKDNHALIKAATRIIRKLAAGFHVKRNLICAISSSAFGLRRGCVTLCDIIYIITLL